MNCQEAEERLPWLLGGGLSADEAAEARAHLEVCAACRQALEETRQAGDVFAAHLPTSVLVDLAWDTAGAQMPPDLAQRHLQSCPDCAEELALLRQSRALEGATELARPTAPPRARAHLAHWAAPLAAGLVIGLGLGLLRDGRPTDVPAAPASPDPQVQRLREDNAALQAQLAHARAPQVNLPVVELFPAGADRGPANANENEAVIPAGARDVALLLAANAASGRPAAVELHDPSGKTVWSADGLLAGGQGAYALALPSALLPDGAYTVVVQPRGSPAIRYALRVRRSP